MGKMGLMPTIGDLDNDGRLEMLLGTSEGSLLLFDADFNLLDADFLHFEKSWSAPCLFDVDEDGVLDLIVGNADGKLSYYQGFSQGNETRFEFVSEVWGAVDVCDHSTSYFGYSVPTLFKSGDESLLSVGSEQGKLFLFKDLQNDILTSSFPTSPFLPFSMTTALTSGLPFRSMRNPLPRCTTDNAAFTSAEHTIAAASAIETLPTFIVRRAPLTARLILNRGT